MALINALLVRSGTGWTERTDAPSIATNTRFEAFLALGAIQTEDGVDAYADSQLDIYADPREEITAGIAPIGTVDTPYLDYQVGDVVTVPDSAGAPTSERVRAITVTEDADTGIAVFTPTFKDFILERAEQIQVAIKKMSNGSLAGSSQVAQPIRENFVPREVPGTLGGTELPFIVVANDGTGDFDDPKAAIDSVATDVSTVIYVKNTDTNYSTGGVDLSGKRIVLWGESALPRWPSTGDTGPHWNLGTSNFTFNGSTRLVVRGMSIGSSGTALGMVAGSQLVMENANIGDGSTLRINGGTTVAYKSLFGIHSTGFTGRIDAFDSLITLPNSTTTLTATQVTWHNCYVFGGGASTHYTLAFSVGSSDGFVSIVGCTFGEFAELILSGWNQATFVGNTNGGYNSGGALAGVLATLTCTGCDHLVLDSMMWGTTLSIATGELVNLKGIWYVTTFAASGSSIAATFQGDRGLGTFPATLLTISGSNNVVSISTNRGTTQGTLVSGDRNTVNVSGTNIGTDLISVSGNDNYVTTAHAAADVNDTGVGNTIASNP